MDHRLWTSAEAFFSVPCFLLLCLSFVNSALRMFLRPVSAFVELTQGPELEGDRGNDLASLTGTFRTYKNSVLLKEEGG